MSLLAGVLWVAMAAAVAMPASAFAVKPGADGLIAIAEPQPDHPGADGWLRSLDPNTGALGGLPNAGMADSDPAWSPDGRWIVHTYRHGDCCVEPTHLALVPADGSAPFRFIAFNAGDPAWSPDGGRVAFTASDGIRLVNPGTGREDHLPGTQAGDTDPTWSPDGAEIAFSGTRPSSGADREIWAIPSRGGALRQLTADRDEDIQPSWSPDGRRIVWASDIEKGERSDLWTMNASDGRAVERLTNDPPYADRDPVWSPSGAYIAYARVRYDVYAQPSIAVMRPDGSDWHVVTPLGSQPDWQRINRPPTANFNALAARPVQGGTLTVASTSSDPDGPLGSERWDLDDDGIFETLGQSATMRVPANASQVRIGLRVADDEGAATVARRTFAVTRRPDPPDDGGATTGPGTSRPPAPAQPGSPRDRDAVIRRAWIPNTNLSLALRRGLRLRVRATRAGVVVVTARLAPSDARRLRLRGTVARGTALADEAGTVTVTLRFTARARTRLVRRRRAQLRLSIEGTDLAGRSTLISRRVTLER